MNIEVNNNIHNNNDYLAIFNLQLSIKKESNKYKRDKFFMSYKRPIPIPNYDYSLFNFIPNLHKQIFIKDLFNKNKTVYKRYYYRYLTGKIISGLYWDDFIYFLIKDGKGDIIAISVYHLDNKYYPLDIDKIQEDYLKKGKYILIINPFFTLEHYEEIMCFDSSEFILFENMESLTIFIEMNNKISNERDLLLIGDLLMEKYQYNKAIFYYEKGIQMCKKKLLDDNSCKVLLAEFIMKIALAYLNYGYFNKALSYTDYFYKFFNLKDIPKMNIIDIKLVIFKIRLKSFFGLRKYKEGYEYYIEQKNDIDIQELIKAEDNDIKELIKQIKLNKENQDGIFNYKKMLLEENTNFYLNYGDFISKKFSIDFDFMKGLKLICNTAIKKGELIIAEKALVSKKSTNNSRNIDNFNLNFDRKESPFQNLEMTHELMEKIKKYKEDYKIFFILYNGKNKILNFKEREESYFKNIEKRIDFMEVKNIIDANKYSASRNIFFDNNKGVGLWGYTSIMNHSCNPNINNFTIGDFMFCFALRDILPGEELCSLYFSNSDHYLLRQEKSKDNWNFNCECNFCISDKNKINDEKKKYYENSIKDFYEFNNDIFKHEKYSNKFIEFENFIKENKKSLDNYEIGNGYLKLIHHYGLLNNYEKSKELSEKMIGELEKENYYSLILENLNCLFCFFGYKDKNINNYLLKRYEKLILSHSNFNKDDFDTLVKTTLYLK